MMYTGERKKPRTTSRTMFVGLLLLTWASGIKAQYPVKEMDSRSLGLGYTFGMRGQDITESKVPSHEVMHTASLAYSPFPYLSLQAGIGVERFSVSPYNQTRFRGDYGFTPGFGITAYSPSFALDFLRATAGTKGILLSSEDTRGYRYSAFINNPFLGLSVSPTIYLDITVGGRLHLVDGTMKSPRSPRSATFANNEIGRGYLSATLKTPFEMAFINLDLDVSPSVDSDWSEGPQESSIAFTIGTLLGWKGKSQPSGKKPVYFPAYEEMKDRQKKMAEELE